MLALLRGSALLLCFLALAACQTEVDAPAPTDNGTTVVPTSAADPIPEPDPDAPLVTVYKSPTCGCCSLWGEYLQREGFRVESRDVTNMGAVKDSLGVPQDLGSCHTATVEGYVIEGHVPAGPIRQLLAEQPEARGLAVPGMPIGSPGMEVGDRVDAYNVLIVDDSGEASIYASIPGS